MKNAYLKLAVIDLIIISFGLLAVNETSAVVDNKGESPEKSITQCPIAEEYVPNELIVKLKEGKNLEDVKKLNDKYGVVLSEKVFKETKSPEDNLKDNLAELKDKLAKLGTEHDKWFWQLDKNSQEHKDYIAKIEKGKEELQKQIQAQEELIAKLEVRQKRAPEGAIAPKLNNIYVLKTKDNVNLVSMVAEYKANADVEYAEPNYMVTAQMVPNDPYYASSNSWG